MSSSPPPPYEAYSRLESNADTIPSPAAAAAAAAAAHTPAPPTTSSSTNNQDGLVPKSSSKWTERWSKSKFGQLWSKKPKTPTIMFSTIALVLTALIIGLVVWRIQIRNDEDSTFNALFQKHKDLTGPGFTDAAASDAAASNAATLDSAASDDLIVDLGYASYQGTLRPNNVRQFLGMRYAEPPVGALRWKAPVAPANVSGIQAADTFGPICLGLGPGYDAAHQSEDCLFVNVWTPSGATVGSKLPVWVNIQGGGFQYNADANWNGAQIVEVSENNVVMVTFNSRVGLWGFLSGSDVKEEGNLNAGLLDQRFLLEWVQQNIAKFGGNPDHVVIQGLSAGAGAVAFHMAAPPTTAANKPLFVGAICDSVFFPPQLEVADLQEQYDRVVTGANCNRDSAAERMQCLRAADVRTLQALNVVHAGPGRARNPHFYWAPCVDGVTVPTRLYDAYTHGTPVSVPLLIGNVTNEGSIFSQGVADPPAFLQDNFPLLAPAAINTLLTEYPANLAAPALASAMFGDAHFNCPARAIATAHTAPTWSYRFHVVDGDNAAAGLGVPHGMQGPAVFGPDGVGGAPASFRTYNAPIVPVIMRYYTSFVRALDPNAHRLAGTPEWPTWDAAQPRRLVLETGNVRAEQPEEGEAGRCAAWSRVAGQTRQ